jgi:hypothetical protein
MGALGETKATCLAEHAMYLLVYVAGFSLAGFALCRQVICCAIVGRFARLNMCGASADCMWQPVKVATQQRGNCRIIVESIKST